MHEEEEYSLFLEQNYAAVTTRLKIMSELDISERRLPQDGAINFRERFEDIDIDIRLSILPNVRSAKFFMRILVVFFARIDPASKKPNPACMKMFSVPINTKNIALMFVPKILIGSSPFPSSIPKNV